MLIIAKENKHFLPTATISPLVRLPYSYKITMIPIVFHTLSTDKIYKFQTLLLNGTSVSDTLVSNTRIGHRHL